MQQAMNLLTDPPVPFMKKELPQRSTRRSTGALRDISNQAPVVPNAEKVKKAAKVSIIIISRTIF